MRNLPILNEAPYGGERACHGARVAGSACAAGLPGKPVSTLGLDKRRNPMLSMAPEACVDALAADIPPPPRDMARIVEASLRDQAPRGAPAGAPN
ncbi:hypothetical protein [Ramlibacter sp. 2FC]|uniref:hypothetical protein n=1 Tax=Ramlibacter sp. 2FC TaxID=2502188 RepID=UPI0010F7020D|nr:hypothetical protein [Ramlibacter sp. 2FC]